MPEDDVPEIARQHHELVKYQQKQYEENQRQREQNYNADLSAFVSFIGDLDADQLGYLKQLIEEISASAYAQQLIGIIIGSRVYSRGLMVDGKSYEEALGLDDGEPLKAGDTKLNPVEQYIEGAVDGIDTDLIPPAPPEPEPAWEWTMEDKEAAEHLKVRLRNDGTVTCEGVCGGSANWNSLDSRIRDEVDNGGCPHCISKTKWG